MHILSGAQSVREGPSRLLNEKTATSERWGWPSLLPKLRAFIPPRSQERRSRSSSNAVRENIQPVLSDLGERHLVLHVELDDSEELVQ